MKKIFLLSIAVILLIFIAPLTVNATGVKIVEIDSNEDLVKAIKEQEDNQKWIIKAGTYDIKEEIIIPAEKKDKLTSTYNYLTNWYFPIYSNGLQIVGEGDVLITSTRVTANEDTNTQDFVAVFGDNVSIENVDFKCKEENNKVIEVMGQNFKLKNSTCQKVNKSGSGSIAFTSMKNGNIGDAVLENVTLYSWVNAGYSTSGKLTTKNVTIDFTNNEYAGYSDAKYSPEDPWAWRPLIKAPGNIVLNNTNFTLKVDGEINLTEQVFMDLLPDNSTIILEGDVAVEKMVNIAKNNITFDLNGHKITASSKFTSTDPNKNDETIINVSGQNVTIKNGTVVTTEKIKHGINIYNTKNAVLENMTIDHTTSKGGSPVVVNNSSATVKEKLSLVLGAKSWYGINVDPKAGNASLAFDNGSKVTMKTTGETKKAVIYIDKIEINKEKVTISGFENAGLVQCRDNQGKENGAYSLIPTVSEKIEEELKDKATGEIVVLASVEDSISKEVLNELKGKDVDVVIEVENGVEISFNGKDIKDNFTNDLSLNVVITEEQPFESNILNNDNSEVLFIDLEYSGVLPTGTKITFDATSVYVKGDKVALYYYNPETDKAELVSENVTVDEKGKVTISIDHASTYFLSKAVETVTPGGSENDNGNTSEEGLDDTPKTGIVSYTAFVGAVVLASVAGMTILKKRMK